ncbi:MAG TPA: FemAB family XrtA/PEP-CTERM system-associated protein [Gemmatimonadaceae bacterium]|nr:FemAB family XrtA/PEP-CTERM system-associated protein [Gemmatimonadaceae bacterium]
MQKAAMTICVSTYTGDSNEWNRFVRTQSHWTHFHLYGWRSVIERVFGHECIYLEAREESGRLVGVLPLVRLRSLLFGHFLVSMPFVNYGGPIGSDEAIRALVDASAQLASQHRVRLLELRSRAPLPTAMAVSHRKITVVLDLPLSEDALWRSLPAKVRSQVRRPQKEGVEIRFGIDQIEPFYEVFTAHMRDLGTPAQSLAFFKAIADEFPNEVRFACAYLGEQPIACGCGFLWNDEFEITWASALRSHKQLSANMLVYWTLMQRAIADGAKVFNFGRCTPGSGTHRFKLQWGARDEELWWYQHSGNGNETGTTPSPGDARYSLASRVWQRLPVSMTRKLGPSIVQYIP